MTHSRRTFLAALAGLPVLGRAVAKPEPAPLTIPGGENFVGFSTVPSIYGNSTGGTMTTWSTMSNDGKWTLHEHYVRKL